MGAAVAEPAAPAPEGEPAVAPEGEPAAEPEGEPAAEPTAAPPTPGPIKVLVDRDHPIRGMGIEYLEAGSPQQERALRALLNGTYTRRAEVAERDTQIQELQERIIEYESGQAAMQRWEQSPEYRAASERYHRLKDLEAEGHVPEGTADDFWRGARLGAEAVAQEEYNTRYEQMLAENRARAGAQFADDAWGYAQRLPQHITSLPGFGQLFNEALYSFNAELELGHYQHLRPGDVDSLHQEFTRFFGSRLARDSAAMAAHRQYQDAQNQRRIAAKAATDQRTRDAEKTAAVDQFKQQVADKRQQMPPHPLGQVASAARDRVPTETQPAPPEPGQLSPHEYKKQLRRGAREDARRHFQR
jgi:hypothetical protein